MQVLADFIVKNTLLSTVETTTSPQELDPKTTLTLYVDRFAAQKQKGEGFVLESTGRMEFALCPQVKLLC